MSNERQPFPNSTDPMIYQIRIRGHLDSHWAAWFGDLSIEPDENGESLLVGPIQDQAALHGLLRKLRDLGIPLIAINPIASRPGLPKEKEGVINDS